MNDRSKIPIPWSQRWRSLRFRVLPFLVFALAVSGTAYLWNRQLTVTQAVGEVYGRRIDVAVAQDGVLLDAPYRSWRLYDHVKAGEVLARLDDRPTLASIDIVRREVEKAQAELGSLQEEWRVKQDDREFQRASEGRRLAVEVENRRLEIAARQALLAADEIELARQQERLDVVDRLLARDAQLMSQLDSIEVKRLRDVAQERIAGHKRYIADAQAALQPALARLKEQNALVQADVDRMLSPLRANIAYQEARIGELQLAQQSLEVRTPLSGFIVRTASANTVTAAQPIAATPGQQVRAGTVLFTVASDDPEYIVSYVRPAQRLRPEVGMTVAVRPRGGNEVANAPIDRVGPQVELIPAHQLRDQKLQEWGLPVRIEVPRALRLRPGELVDLRFLPPPPPAANDAPGTRG